MPNDERRLAHVCGAQGYGLGYGDYCPGCQYYEHQRNRCDPTYCEFCQRPVEWKDYRVTVSCDVDALHEGLARVMARSALQRGEYTILSVEEIKDERLPDQEG
jgi:hypothetical protein